MSKPIHIKSTNSQCEIIPTRGSLVTKLILDGQDILWMPPDFSVSDSSWPGGGLPLCFPFAGRLWHEGMLYRYQVNNTAHHMPLHGFAFASSFGIKSQKPDRARLILRDTEASRILFPFSFELSLEFAISKNALEVSFEVIHSQDATSKGPMPVALGWHPYFSVKESASAKIEIPAQKFYPVTPAGAAGKATEIGELGRSPWSINQPLMNSLIFTNLKENNGRFSPGDGSRPVEMSFGETIPLNFLLCNGRHLFNAVVCFTHEPSTLGDR
ncbi:MAG: hypothetical protein NTV34_19400 [Proteobacteria bacterium]|nr:hypothetical protein [Pseudomonadota bacterium]